MKGYQKEKQQSGNKKDLTKKSGTNPPLLELTRIKNSGNQSTRDGQLITGRHAGKTQTGKF